MADKYQQASILIARQLGFPELKEPAHTEFEGIFVRWCTWEETYHSLIEYATKLGHSIPAEVIALPNEENRTDAPTRLEGGR